MQNYRANKLLDPAFECTDDRIHPDYSQLGTDTGRQTSRFPNVLAIPGELRPLIVPEPGCGIGEIDLSQIEPGLAGALYGDDHLVKLFNSGDVYSAMAQVFFKDELDPQALALPESEFKARYPERRSQMKTCTLGIIYGLTAHGISEQLNIPQRKAAQLQRQFMNLFPQLKQQLEQTAVFAGIRGYAQTSTGLHRHRGSQNIPTSWETNWMTNHPVQGSAAAVSKSPVTA